MSIDAFSKAMDAEIKASMRDFARDNLRANKTCLEGFRAIGWQPTRTEVEAEVERLWPGEREGP